MNLIVDGKIVRTATGKGTPNLTDASFDVSEFVGKKAHIEIVDATASADRGYIMVDDMAFVAKMPPVYNRDGFMPPITANQCRLLDFAVKNAKDSRVRNDTYEG